MKDSYFGYGGRVGENPKPFQGFLQISGINIFAASLFWGLHI
jgi:hypothetical protein